MEIDDDACQDCGGSEPCPRCWRCDDCGCACAPSEAERDAPLENLYAAACEADEEADQ